MSTANSYPLEITQALLNCGKNTHFDFGEETALVAVQHLLRQTVDLFETVGQMGLDVKNCFTLGKVYSNSPLVIERLREIGVTVVETTFPEPGEFHTTFERDVERLWQIVADALDQRSIKRILVLDDGGVCISNVPAGIRQRYSICGVEQTSQGMFLFEKKLPPFGVILWARSAVKLEVGGPIFSQCFVEKLFTEFLHGASLKEVQIGIIGLGSIGKGVANLLARRGARVSFYDPGQGLQLSRYLRERVTRFDTLEELMLRCDYVIGCSGRKPFEERWPLAHRPGVNLFSASGGDQEFGAIIRDLKQRPGFDVNSESLDLTSAHGPSGPIRIAYHGYPYNFVSRGVEAVPTRIVQLESGGLLAALMQARLFLESCEAGETQNTGIHRVSPQAQRFVYEKWLRTMTEHRINIAEIFAYDPSLLSAAQYEDWFVAKSEPQPGKEYQPLHKIEETMTRLVRGGYLKKAPCRAGA